MKVMIAESSYPDDFYRRELDGNSVASLLNTICVPNELRYVLDFTRLKKSIKESVERQFNVIHLSCHGDQNGIALADDCRPTWEEFTQIFQEVHAAPSVLVMSSCCGASSGISKAFERQESRPNMIFGSTEALCFSAYAVAWSILYHRLKTDGVKRSVAQTALKQIIAVVHESFVYRRWDDTSRKYLIYPGSNKAYEVTETHINSE